MTAIANPGLIDNADLAASLTAAQAGLPTGTPVRYWPLACEGEGTVGTTRTPVHLLGGHTLVVWIEGVSGCIGLSHVQALPTPGEQGVGEEKS
jgi:hypothetical protein